MANDDYVPPVGRIERAMRPLPVVGRDRPQSGVAAGDDLDGDPELSAMEASFADTIQHEREHQGEDDTKRRQRRLSNWRALAARVFRRGRKDDGSGPKA
jgi:hypothetical protein